LLLLEVAQYHSKSQMGSWVMMMTLSVGAMRCSTTLAKYL
jgi:hypothetical protein